MKVRELLELCDEITALDKNIKPPDFVDALKRDKNAQDIELSDMVLEFRIKGE